MRWGVTWCKTQSDVLRTRGQHDDVCEREHLLIIGCITPVIPRRHTQGNPSTISFH